MTTEQKIKKILDRRGIFLTDFMSSSQYDAVVESMKEISSLIPKWRKVEEELPERPHKDCADVSDSIITWVEWGDTLALRINIFNYKTKKWKFSNGEVKYWMYESELLNLIPQ